MKMYNVNELHIEQKRLLKVLLVNWQDADGDNYLKGVGNKVVDATPYGLIKIDSTNKESKYIGKNGGGTYNTNIALQIVFSLEEQEDLEDIEESAELIMGALGSMLEGLVLEDEDGQVYNDNLLYDIELFPEDEDGNKLIINAGIQLSLTLV